MKNHCKFTKWKKIFDYVRLECIKLLQVYVNLKHRIYFNIVVNYGNSQNLVNNSFFKIITNFYQTSQCGAGFIGEPWIHLKKNGINQNVFMVFWNFSQHLHSSPLSPFMNLKFIFCWKCFYFRQSVFERLIFHFCSPSGKRMDIPMSFFFPLNFFGIFGIFSGFLFGFFWLFVFSSFSFFQPSGNDSGEIMIKSSGDSFVDCPQQI